MKIFREVIDWICVPEKYKTLTSNLLTLNYLRPMSKTIITVKDNSALKIEGEFEIVDLQGNSYGLGGRTVVSLCRCGLSQNKPFCDGSHKGKFEDKATAFDLPPKKTE